MIAVRAVPEDGAVEHVQEQQTEKWSVDSRLDECAISSAYGNRLLARRRDGEAAGVSDESETIGGARYARVCGPLLSIGRVCVTPGGCSTAGWR